MEKVILADSLKEQIRSQIVKGHLKNEIEQLFVNKGHDITLVGNIVDEEKKEIYAKKHKQGVSFITAGAIICLLGFLLSVAFAGDAGMLQLSLYGITSVGILLAFGGFMMIF